MVKTLQKYGNSHALVIDKALMDAMGITPETPLSITVSGGSFTVTPASQGIGTAKLHDAASFIKANFNEAMRKLAQ